MEGIIPIALFAAFFVGTILFSWHQDEKRKQALRRVATTTGLTLSEDDGELLHRLKYFHLFSQGSRKRIKNVLRGSKDGIEMVIFDYRYDVNSGDSSDTYYQTVIHLRSSTLRLPQFAMRQESLFHNIGEVFGYQDIDFESHPKFSNRYLLRGEREDDVRRLFNNEVLSFFEQRSIISVEANYDQLICYFASKRIKPEGIGQFLKEGLHIFAQLQKASMNTSPA